MQEEPCSSEETGVNEKGDELRVGEAESSLRDIWMLSTESACSIRQLGQRGYGFQSTELNLLVGAYKGRKCRSSNSLVLEDFVNVIDSLTKHYAERSIQDGYGWSQEVQAQRTPTVYIWVQDTGDFLNTEEISLLQFRINTHFPLWAKFQCTFI